MQPFHDLLFYNLLFEADIFCFEETQMTDPDVFHSFADRWQGSCISGLLPLGGKAVL